MSAYVSSDKISSGRLSGKSCHSARQCSLLSHAKHKSPWKVPPRLVPQMIHEPHNPQCSSESSKKPELRCTRLPCIQKSQVFISAPPTVYTCVWWLSFRVGALPVSMPFQWIRTLFPTPLALTDPKCIYMLETIFLLWFVGITVPLQAFTDSLIWPSDLQKCSKLGFLWLLNF